MVRKFSSILCTQLFKIFLVVNLIIQSHLNRFRSLPDEARNTLLVLRYNIVLSPMDTDGACCSHGTLLVGTCDGKRPLGRTRFRREDNTKMGRSEIMRLDAVTVSGPHT